jgi:hypothetical protein
LSIVLLVNCLLHADTLMLEVRHKTPPDDVHQLAQHLRIEQHFRSYGLQQKVSRERHLANGPDAETNRCEQMEKPSGM